MNERNSYKKINLKNTEELRVYLQGVIKRIFNEVEGLTIKLLNGMLCFNLVVDKQN